MLNSVVIFTFSVLDWKSSFVQIWSKKTKLSDERQNMRFDTKTNSNMLSSMIKKVKNCLYFTIMCKDRKMKGVKKSRLVIVINILKMSCIFTLHQKLRGKFKQFILLTANIHKYKVGEIILPNTALYIRLKSKVFMFNFFCCLILKC